MAPKLDLTPGVPVNVFKAEAIDCVTSIAKDLSQIVKGLKNEHLTLGMVYLQEAQVEMQKLAVRIELARQTGQYQKLT